MDLKLGDTRMIIDACAHEGLLRNQCAYVLATAYHETAATMKPIEEMGGQAYLRSKPYYPFFGRGYVQLTWEAGYKKASGKLGVDFIANPSLLLQSQYAAPILVIGMKEGWFTGKKLSDYIDLQHSDYVGARRIINGTDKANTIALYARQFDVLLKIDGYGEAPAQPATAAPPAPAAPSIIPDNGTVVVVTQKGNEPPVLTNAPVPPAAQPTISKHRTGLYAIIALVISLLAGLIKHFGG